MKLIIITFLLSFFSVQAEQVSNDGRPIFVKYENDRIILISHYCEILEKQFDAISTWKENVEGITSATGMCFCQTYTKGFPRFECQMDITDIIPEKALNMLGKESAYHGPNCFNTTLLVNEILPHQRYTNSKEMQFWMNSPLCEEVRTSQQLEPGDIIAIRKDFGFQILEEYHGFIYLTPELSFSKNKMFKSSPAYFMSTDFVYDHHNIKSECQHQNQKKTNFINCPRTAQIYRCQKWDDYWVNYQFTPQQNKVAQQLEHIECLVGEKTRTGKAKAFDEAFIKDNLKVLMQMAKDNGASQVTVARTYPLDPVLRETKNKEYFFWDAIEYRILSIYQQLVLID